MNESNDLTISYFVTYSCLAIMIIIDLQRIYVAFQPSTRNAQFSFNLWLVGTVVYCLVIVLSEVIYYLFPKLLNQQDTVLENTWIQSHPWIAFVLQMLVGYGLKSILNQRRQLGLEQERQQEQLQQQGYRQFLMSNKDLLPSPVMLTYSMEGFKTEAEMCRSQSRVPTWPRFLVAIWSLWLIIEGVNQMLYLSERGSGTTFA
jgi:hypothetical protein